MRRNELNDLIAFVAVADQLSFRKAATQLGVTPSALSHTIKQLEDRMGSRLLNRTTRSVALTEAGERLVVEIRPAMSRIAAAIDDLRYERKKPGGTVRVYASLVAASTAIIPVWSQFLAAYPSIELQLEVGEAFRDIVAGQFDAGIARRERVPKDMVAIRLTGPLKVAIVGSPSYFARHRSPRTPQDLERHQCIIYRRSTGDAFTTWDFEKRGKQQAVKVNGQLMVNSAELNVRAALDGLGLAYSIESIADPFLRTGQLVRVLEDWSPIIDGLYLFHPSSRQTPAALRALIDVLRDPKSAE
tara:strand:+ start:5706 stop:6608 length:903 start_codon:yes stop_codon:yes gene_type:complete